MEQEELIAEIQPGCYNTGKQKWYNNGRLKWREVKTMSSLHVVFVM